MQITQVNFFFFKYSKILPIFIILIKIVINDSDESSFAFHGKPKIQRDESFKKYEYVKNYNKSFA